MKVLGVEIERLRELGRVARDSARLRRARPGAEKEARERVARRLASLHGLPQKLGQFLALSELQEEEGAYRRLSEAVSPLGGDAARAEIERGLGKPVEAVFRSLELEGIAASLGQVHRGVLLDGRDVAVKFQHPGIAESVDTDLKALGWLAAPAGGWKRGFATAAYRRTLAEGLAEELDYRHEAKNIQEFATLTAGWFDLAVPQVIEELSNERLLVMTWLPGAPFRVTRDWSRDDRERLAGTLLRFFLASCFRWGVVHADPNPGNYRFARDPRWTPRLEVLDFGCVRRLPAPFVAGLRGLVDASARTPAEDLLGFYAGMGFRLELLEPLTDRLPALSQVLYEPFRHSGPFSLAAWDPGARSAEILGELRWNFRFAGPPELLFLLRAYRGLLAYLRALAVPVDWRRVLEEACRDAPAAPAPSFRLAENPFGTPTAGGARTLRVRVSEEGRTKVDLTFRAAMVEHLADLIPDELQPKLEERRIDVPELARTAVERGVVPGALFRLDEEGKEIRVWLE